jgi:hypothetical protein
MDLPKDQTVGYLEWDTRILLFSNFCYKLKLATGHRPKSLLDNQLSSQLLIMFVSNKTALVTL